ncbi:NADH-FMN oxidoreductase RutF, flavin reductase (DIM6/NTAB) family [Actinacidiphila yanglinensis]|uniref:NADH-FMN oxidoreductase RutF, flavin reductase (DIM6/NTAB) family n=1 Tax=Actinacidiphila yanglinensis TaxID=310779 RepID=A0A1H6E8K5_9ACTN|nr:flavin reductase family protein [Actinacidiphila yanglinensis]SEG93603.1 NADH-FMN oxidoreductase RutF, flavin reductase (DIM6/NTAB) family [Actinacidiphila yanglinensis]
MPPPPAPTPPVPPAGPVDAQLFRAIMGALPTGVTVVTTIDAQGEPCGFTCSASCSVSQDPPLLLVCVNSRSRVLRAMRSTGAFAVNILRDSREWVSAHFASGADDRFSSVAWKATDQLGLPWLPDDTVAFAECRVDSAITAGDHTVVIGSVIGGEARQTREPLMYWRREYAGWPLRDAPYGITFATEG